MDPQVEVNLRSLSPWGRAQEWEEELAWAFSLPGPEQENWPGFVAAVWDCQQIYLPSSLEVSLCPPAGGMLEL